MKRVFIVILSFLLFCLCACTPENSVIENNTGIDIVATSFASYSLVKEAVGDTVNVELLIPPGLDSHSFDPTISDISRLMGADMVIYSGDTFDAWMKPIASTLAEKCVFLVDISSVITLSHDSHNHLQQNEHTHDPHILSSPKNALLASNIICESMCEIDAENAEFYCKRFSTLKEQISEIDAELKTIANESEGKTLYFGGKFSNAYLMKDYGFDYISAYDSCGEYSEPSPKTLNEIIEKMKNDSSSVIFVSELSERKTAEKICNSVGCKISVLHSCHEISKDDFEKGETYTSLMKKNIENIREALS